MYKSLPPIHQGEALISSSGIPISLCALCQISKNVKYGSLANFVVEGLSVCSDHLDEVVQLIVDGNTVKDILQLTLGGS